MPDVLWKLEPATKAKHRLYERYLGAWWAKLLQSSFPRVTYVDAFAGPGRYLGGEPGSPIMVLEQLLHHEARDRMRLSRERVCMLFSESDSRRHNHLQNELTNRFGALDQMPIDVRPPCCGDAGDLILPMLSRVGAWGHPILAILDSWGNVNVPLDVIAAIAHNKSSEVIVTFGPNWFSRRERLNPDDLDRVFGGRQYWRPADAEQRPDERWRVWLETYQEALRRAGFEFTLQFEIVPATGQPLYLVYGTGRTEGLQAMKDAMWKVDGHEGLRFSDPRLRGTRAPDQLTLFEDDPGVTHPELIELTRQRLAGGPLTVQALGHWLLTETSQWLPKHAAEAARHLRDEAAATLLPAGRVTRDTLIQLRT